MKKVVRDVLIGIIVGVFIGFVLSLIISVAVGKGIYYPSSPDFMNNFDTTMGAMVASAGLWAVTGCIFSISSSIFFLTDWSITKMTIVHFCLTLGLFIPVAMLAGWVSFHSGSFILFILIFVSIYYCMWRSFMHLMTKEVEELNGKLQLKK